MSPGALFYRLSAGAQQLGYASSTVDTLGDSLRLVDVLVVDQPALGHLGRTEGRSVATLDRSLHLGSLASEVDGETVRFEARAHPAADRRFQVTIRSGADSTVATLPAGAPVEVPSLWPLRLAFGGSLHPGRTGAARVLDPFSTAVHDLDLRIAAESTFVIADSADFDSTTMAWVPVRFDTVRAFGVLSGAAGSGDMTVWIDAQGRVVRATSPSGFLLERTAFELAYENFRRRDTLRLMRVSAAPGIDDIVPAWLVGTGLRPEATAPVEFRTRLSGGALDGLDLAGGRQRLAGDTLIVRREGAAELVASYRLPNADSAFHAWLLPDLLIPSADLRVAAQARLVAGAERSPTRVAALLVQWVAGAVQPDRSPTVADAATVLEARRGDANQHAALFVALARSLGLPARPVTGLVRAAGRYYYHAWAEVYLGGWVAVDPTFGQFPADPVHLRLAIGGLVQPADLARLLGRLTLDPP